MAKLKRLAEVSIDDQASSLDAQLQQLIGRGQIGGDAPGEWNQDLFFDRALERAPRTL